MGFLDRFAAKPKSGEIEGSDKLTIKKVQGFDTSMIMTSQGSVRICDIETERLCSIVTDPASSSTLCEVIIKELGARRDPNATESLLSLLNKKDYFYWLESLKSIAKTGDKRAIQHIVKQLLDRHTINDLDFHVWAAHSTKGQKLGEL